MWRHRVLSESLAALHDRFIFRMNVNYISDAGNKKRMHHNYIDNRAGLSNLVSKTKITLDELKALQEASKTVRVSKDIVNAFIRLISDLNRQAIHVSDRRQNECFKIMQGSAVLAGRKVVSLDDFKALTYVLWEKEEHIPTIESTILKMVNPYDDKFKEIKNNFAEIKEKIDQCTDPTIKQQKSLESKVVIEKLVGKVNKLVNEASRNGKDTEDFIKFRDSMVQYNQQLLSSALGATFNGFSF